MTLQFASSGFSRPKPEDTATTTANAFCGCPPFPAHVLQQIFSRLDFLEITRVICVCKEWRSVGMDYLKYLRKAEIVMPSRSKMSSGRRLPLEPCTFSKSVSRQLTRWAVAINRNLETLIVACPVESRAVDLILNACPNLKHLVLNISSKSFLQHDQQGINNFMYTTLESLFLTVTVDYLDFDQDDIEIVPGSVLLPPTTTAVSLHVEEAKSGASFFGPLIDFDPTQLSQRLPSLIALEHPHWPDNFSREPTLGCLPLKLRYLRVDYGDNTVDHQALDGFLCQCPDLRVLILGEDVPTSNTTLDILTRHCPRLQVAWLVDLDFLDPFRAATLEALYKAVSKNGQCLADFCIVTSPVRERAFLPRANFRYVNIQHRLEIPNRFALKHAFTRRLLDLDY